MRISALFLFCMFLVVFPLYGQFSKHVDEHGHVTYSDDPGYDYGQDEPSAADYEASLERQRQLERSLPTRQTPRSRGRAALKPAITVRSKTHCPRVTKTLCGDH
jgi:hypothetical protein